MTPTKELIKEINKIISKCALMRARLDCCKEDQVIADCYRKFGKIKKIAEQLKQARE